jgi:hypothetical protein
MSECVPTRLRRYPVNCACGAALKGSDERHDERHATHVTTVAIPVLSPILEMTATVPIVDGNWISSVS